MADGTVSYGEGFWDGQLYDGQNLSLGTATGTSIGTAANQKLGFWGASGVVQQSGTGSTAGFTQGSMGIPVLHNSTFTGGSGFRAYTIDDIVRHLKAIGILKKD